MEDILASGKVKAIGVCNWSIPYLEKLKRTWRVKPAVNQVELHPYLPQRELRSWCEREGILVEAYSPLGGSGKNLLRISLKSDQRRVTDIPPGAGAPIAKDSVITSMASKYNVSPANILVSYHVNQGTVPLVKSTSSERLKSNLKVVQLDKDDLKTLNELSKQPGKYKRYNTPLFGWDLGFSDWYEQK